MLWLSTSTAARSCSARFCCPSGCLLGFARLPWRGRWLTCRAGLVGTAPSYAAVGGYQWFTRDVFWNRA